jgi:hypothetical protein
LDLPDGSARLIEPSAGSVKVVGEEAEGPYVLPHHPLHRCSYRPRLFQRKVKFESAEALRKLSLSRKGVLDDVIQHSKVALVQKEGRLSHLLPSKSQFCFIILSKAGLEQRGATALMFAVAEEVQDHPKHFRGFGVCSVSLLEFFDAI